MQTSYEKHRDYLRRQADHPRKPYGRDEEWANLRAWRVRVVEELDAERLLSALYPVRGGLFTPVRAWLRATRGQRLPLP